MVMGRTCARGLGTADAGSNPADLNFPWKQREAQCTRLATDCYKDLSTRERERGRQRQKQRQTKTERQTETDKERDRDNRQTDRQAGRQADKQKATLRDTQLVRQRVIS